ncbi:hypothetical protein, partial [Pseudomonas fragi]|uniref:hypothetical protein n=1 Tax=Pseudomonas fragi TaxID=296 RepID=UPI001CB70344
MRANENLNEEISLFDVYAFFIRQIKLISIVFLIVFVVGITYSTTRPTLYKSTSNVTIGKSVSLNSNTVALLERPEEIAYKYSNNATITGRRQKLSATPDLSGTVLPLCLIPNSALKSAPPFKSVVPKASA